MEEVGDVHRWALFRAHKMLSISAQKENYSAAYAPRNHKLFDMYFSPGDIIVDVKVIFLLITVFITVR